MIGILAAVSCIGIGVAVSWRHCFRSWRTLMMVMLIVAGMLIVDHGTAKLH